MIYKFEVRDVQSDGGLCLTRKGLFPVLVDLLHGVLREDDTVNENRKPCRHRVRLARRHL
jgi:hypothetical protein